jgi:hypothetical protein
MFRRYAIISDAQELVAMELEADRATMDKLKRPRTAPF